MKNTACLALMSFALAALTGCGAKGPLFMPEEAAPIEVPAEAPVEGEEDASGAADDDAVPMPDAAAPEPAQAQPPVTPGSDG
jgi:predicted small lipoprotein YifL